ncbi:chemotaxis protein CheA [Salmonella enterica subsp. enterica]|uniref:histidine kinase n=1 Tax=Salmonella enterica I TaxID=59201 RepID=A0A379WTQ5_SALET|nr:chemotaxis protein CheA [Salmonella enterica subsp. enterica]
MKRIFIRCGRERVLEVRGEYLPLVELWKVFDVDGAKTEATQGIVVILQSAGRRYALLVDQLIGQHQVVVKNLESNYRKVPGFPPRRSWATAASR